MNSIEQPPIISAAQLALLLAGMLSADQKAALLALLEPGGITHPITSEQVTNLLAGALTAQQRSDLLALLEGGGGAAPVLPYYQPWTPYGGPSVVAQSTALQVWAFPIDRWPGAPVLAVSLRVSAMGGASGQYGVGWYSPAGALIGQTRHVFSGQGVSREEPGEPIAVPDGTAIVALANSVGFPVGYAGVPMDQLGVHPLAGVASNDAVLDGEGNISMPAALGALDASTLTQAGAYPPWLLVEC